MISGDALSFMRNEWHMGIRLSRPAPRRASQHVVFLKTGPFGFGDHQRGFGRECCLKVWPRLGQTGPKVPGIELRDLRNWYQMGKELPAQNDDADGDLA